MRVAEMWLRFVAVVIALGVTPAIGQEAAVEVRALVAPTVVVGADGREYFGYELHVTNVYRSTGVLRLERVDVFADAGRVPLVTYDGAALAARVLHPGVDPSVRYARTLDGGMRAVVHVWATLPADMQPPRTLRHHLVFVDDKGVERTVDSAPLEISVAAPAVLGAPLRGGQWLVHNGPGNNQSPHWGSVLARNGRVTIPQRFAVDWIGVDDTGRAVKGDFRKSANEDWVGFGAEVIAVADGIVRDARDGIADHAPLVEPPPPDAVTLEAVGGNYVLLELSGNVFVYYAHLERNSVAVRVGDRVARGQVLGRLGASGNTNAPHLHFHVGDGPFLNDSEGLPFVLDTLELIGATTADYAVAGEGAPVTLGNPQRRRRTMPLHGMVVRLP